MTNHTNSLAVSAGLRAALGYHRLVCEIGRGGMAGVFLSLFPNGDGTTRKIVLKQLHPELAMDDDFRAMFEDEARVATRLHHHNVVETYDIYSDPDLCVLVMEFLEGQTLSRVRQRARKVGNVPLLIHLRVLAEVLAGLHYVHELSDQGGKPLGIVHRDVTPSNVFITYDGQVKVVDFGIAKATTCIAETRIGVLKGKLAYMSPEAVQGEPVDRRSDIFSVGVMLWEAATGLRFWQDHDDVAVFRRLATGDLPLYRAGMQIPNGELFGIVQRALAIEPCQRYEDARQMQQEIESLLVRLGNLTEVPALSVLMESWFAVERERLKKLIERAEARFPAQPLSQRRLAVNGPSESCVTVDPSEPPTAVSTPSGTTFRGASYDVPLDSDDLPDFRPRRHGFVLGAGAAALSVGIAVVAHGPTVMQKVWLGSAVHRSPGAAAMAEPMVAQVAAPADPAPAPLAPDGGIPAASARTGQPVERSAPAPKVRRGKREPDREDPWGI